MSGLRRLLARLRPHTAPLAVAVTLGALGGAIPAAAVWLVREALGRGAVEPAALAAASAGFATLYVANGALSLARTSLVRRVSGSVASALRRGVNQRILAGAVPEGAGAAVSAALHDVDEVHHGIGALVAAVRLPVTLGGLSTAAFALAPGLAPWALVLLPLVAAPTVWGGAVVRRRARAVRAARARLTALAHEQAAGARELRVAGAGVAEAERFARLDDADRAARLRLEVERVLPTAGAEAAAAVAIGGLLWLGGRAVLADQLDTASLVGFGVALALLARPLGQIAETWAQLQRSLAATERVDELLALPDRPAEPRTPRPLPAGPLGVGWRKVTVRLGDREVLSGFDLDVRPGERLVLVGPSGAGKTTALRALLREVEVVGGVIVLTGADGEVPIEEVALADLRRTVAWVSQDPLLFDRSIVENVALGRDGDALAALASAAASFAAHRPGSVEERGAALSGGERQRVALARAFHGSPAVLLLDEATNQVDAAREREVIAALTAQAADRATVMVAHDLRVALAAPRIVVLVEGRVVADGPPQTVLASPHFRAMCDAAGLA